MQTRDERGVLFGERALHGEKRVVPDWEAVRIFLEIVRKGCFRAAADHLGQSVNALRRRVAELERDLGAALLTRHVDGVRTTAEGDHVVAAATRMEAASFGILQAKDQGEEKLTGEVRLAVTEGIVTFWIAPKLVDFQRANPGLLVDVNCAMKSAHVLRMEADLAIQITRPTAPVPMISIAAVAASTNHP